jgi:hypothetical protein
LEHQVGRVCDETRETAVQTDPVLFASIQRLFDHGPGDGLVDGRIEQVETELDKVDVKDPPLSIHQACSTNLLTAYALLTPSACLTHGGRPTAHVIHKF